MVLAVEILIGTLTMANLIRDGKVFQIPSMMQMGKSIGMQTMDDSILALLQEGKISEEEARLNANNKNLFARFSETERKAA
jgi:twitching motility protein PilT